MEKKAPARREFQFLPVSLRLETLGGVATPLVLRGTPLPAKRSENFSTAADNQISVEIKLLMGESPLARNDLHLGRFHLRDIPPAVAGKPQITVNFSVRADCAVTVRATLEGTQLAAEETMLPPKEMTDEFIASLLSSAEQNRVNDEAELLKVEETNRARRLIKEAEAQLVKGHNKRLEERIASLGLALASDDIASVRERSDALAAALSPSAGFGGFDFSSIFGSMPSTSPQHRASFAKRKPADLQLQLTPNQPAHVMGRIFGGTSFTLDPQLCFVLMPFDEKFQALYDDHIKPSVERAGLRCERADDVRGTSLITWDIWERVNRARFLVAELTDQNPNVFYELGLAHALSKEVILITQSMDFVPFDLKTIRCIVYDFTPRGTQKLEKGLAETISALMKSA